MKIALSGSLCHISKTRAEIVGLFTITMWTESRTMIGDASLPSGKEVFSRKDEIIEDATERDASA